MRFGPWVAGLLAVAMALAGCSDDGAPAAEKALEGEVPTHLTGVVQDEDGTPLEGATVTVVGEEKSTLTDDEGKFAFPLPAGVYSLEVVKHGYFAASTTVTGRDPIVIPLKRDPSTYPYWVMTEYEGYLACGFALYITSIGCATMPGTGDLTGSVNIWPHEFGRADIRWSQGELLWDTGATGTQLIWEVVPRASNSAISREVGESPALIAITDSFFATGGEIAMGGVDYRFHGGPHPLCRLPTGDFGCGVTLQQEVEAVVHDFYGLVPPEGWRYTRDGDPVAAS